MKVKKEYLIINGTKGELHQVNIRQTYYKEAEYLVYEINIAISHIYEDNDQ